MSQSSYQAAELTDIPPRTIRHWVAEFERMGDSDLEAWIASKRRALGGVWQHMEEEALGFAAEMRHARDAKAFQAAMTAAGIAHDKTKLLGNPRNVTQSAATDSNPLIIEHPVSPTDSQQPTDATSDPQS